MKIIVRNDMDNNLHDSQKKFGRCCGTDKNHWSYRLPRLQYYMTYALERTILLKHWTNFIEEIKQVEFNRKQSIKMKEEAEQIDMDKIATLRI